MAEVDTESRAEKAQARQFLALLIALLAMMVAPIIFGPILVESRFSGLMWVVVLAVTIYALGGRGKLYLAALIFGPPVLLARVVSVSVTTQMAELVSHATSAAFLGFAIYVIMTAVMRPGHVTMDKIYGAICVYLLLGILWGSLYNIVELAEPGSFKFTDPGARVEAVRQQEYRELEAELNYYSFVTLTTLGYGDVTPVTDRARGLAWLEAVFGQLFIAITIARLVGAEVASRRDDD